LYVFGQTSALLLVALARDLVTLWFIRPIIVVFVCPSLSASSAFCACGRVGVGRGGVGRGGIGKGGGDLNATFDTKGTCNSLAAIASKAAKL
jgi:hypothetical protein